jgi:6-phosphogluconolactonase
MANRALRLLEFIFAIFCLIALAACGSNQTACPLSATSTNGCGCGNVPVNACAAPSYVFGDGLDGKISTFSVDNSTGELTLASAVTGPSASLGMAQLQNRFLYVSDFQLPSIIDAWSINLGNGALTPVPGSPFSMGSLSVAAGLAADNVHSTLYVGDAARIDAFKADATGAITAISGSPFPGGTNIYLAVDPQGHFLFAARIDPPGSVAAYTIDPASGALTAVAGSPFPIIPSSLSGVQPAQIAVDTSGKFVYVTLTSGGVGGSSIDPSTGVLTVIPGSPFTSGVTPLSVAAAGKFLYVGADGSVVGYSVDPTTGVLTPVAGSPFSIVTGSLTTNLVGNYLYTAGATGIAAYKIDPNTGALTESGSNVPYAGAFVLTFVQ